MDQRNQHLGINKLGKSIRKSPLHQPNYNFTPPILLQPPSQPQVYNISKNDFRSVVQQLTGTPSRDVTGGDHNPPPPPPPAVTRPPPPKPPSMRLQMIRPPPLSPILPNPTNHFAHTHHHSNFVAESPVTAYMKYLESSLLYSDGNRPQLPLLPSPRHMNPGLLPSPNAPPSPSSFLNLISPKSPYPLLSPGYYPPPLSPNFTFSPLAQAGILGRSPGAYPPPSGFFPSLSPRWRDV